MSLKQQVARVARIVNNEAKISLNTNVAEKVVEMGKKNVQTVVYDAYPEPLVYRRTMDLRDRSWELTPIDGGVRIRTNRTDGGKQVSMIVESGQGYTNPDTNMPPKYGLPRPFMEVTREQIQSDNTIRDILLKDLRKNLGVQIRVK